MESTRRLFTEAEQRFLRVRDERCRTPWCGAPIRHNDHVRAHTDGGATTVIIRTPTGHTYRSPLPDPPGQRHHLSGVEWWFLEHLAAA